MPHTKRNKGKVEERKFKTQGTFSAPNPPSPPLNETLPVDSRHTATTAIPESGAPQPHLCQSRLGY